MSSRTGRPGGDFSTPDVDGGGRKAYDGAVFRSENVSRSVVLARVRLHGEKRRVGCVRRLVARSRRQPAGDHRHSDVAARGKPKTFRAALSGGRGAMKTA